MYRQCDTAGPVHINCPFPEPLYGEQDTSRFESYLAGVQKTKNGKKPYTARHRAQVTALDAIGNIEKKKGLIVVGSVDISDAEHAKMLADALGWPVLCDPQSGTSSLWQHYDLWLRSDVHRDTLAQCDLILQFGGRIVSKTLNRFIKQQAQQGQTDYYLVCQDEQPLNPDHLPQRQLFANTTLWVHNQLDALGCDVGQATNLNLSIESSEHSQWASKLKEVSKKTKALVQEVEAFSELGMAMSIPGIIRRGDLFIGNSLIVRLLDMVAALEGNRTYSNRGASGIDGLVATAAGVQRIHQEPLFMVLGDTSMLYDLNSLALFSDTDMTSVILVINNDGGAIFDLLPVPAEKRKNLYQMPHGFQFKYAAKQFGLKYLRPDSMDELIGVAIEHLESGKGALLVELETRSGQASQDINTLVQEVNALR
jgi:2-succinyl-5-enolpyruvyl-6-hydroxy-3-cyclohexene-1-carboxylate synthase